MITRAAAAVPPPPRPRRDAARDAQMRIAAMAALGPAGEYIEPQRQTRLNHMDLFSGCGGNAYAFADFVKPRLYCETDPTARAALRANMKAGLIGKAPVHTDVRTLLGSKLYAQAKTHRPLLVSGSWPCQGNSCAGEMQGLWDPRSALLMTLCDIILDSQAELFFMENVPQAATNESWDYIQGKLAGQYIIRHEIISAAQLGFPHVRKRFFCVGIKRGFDLFGLKFGGAQRLLLSHKLEPPRGQLARPPGYENKWKHLGNAVVPACSNYAFLKLLGVRGAGLDVFKPWNGPPLVLNPNSWRPPKGVVPRELTSPAITEPFPLHLWPTPRAACNSAVHALSYRTTRDLASAVRFEQSTPARQRAFVNIGWLKWLMGYPQAFAF